MARIHPEGWRQLPASGARARELATLALFADALPDDFAVYHGLHWTRAEGEHTVFGEIGFAVVGPAGRVVLIEQQSGFLDESDEGLLRPPSRRARRISVELARCADALRTRLRPLLQGAEPQLEILFYCPDYRVRHPGTAGLDPARIVDAGRRGELVAIVKALAGGHAQPGAADAARPAAATDPEYRAALHRFFADLLELVPDVQALAGRAEALTTRLSGGLAEWARRLEFSPFRLHVTATAGSGKTQLALAAYEDALRAGRRPLYVCYNRPLADHFARIAPPGGEVATFHQLCDRRLRAAGRPPNFAAPGAFRRMEADFAALVTATPDPAWRFDELIVDEGQDFAEGWRDALLALLAADGRAWWLEDPLQNLYGRPRVLLPGWVRISADTNYRTPADILDLLNRCLPLPAPVRAGSPVAGSAPEVIVWQGEGEQGLMDATRRAITRAIGLGFRRDMIALVTFRGREHSRFTPITHLGPHRLRAFSGRYDLFGEP
ncbi:MAG: nuclease, partial [Proteobacteria bacterium]|nr:nuclease [Pseudomonadota bacterium]